MPQRYSSPFPPLTLSESEKATFRQQLAQLVQDACTEYSTRSQGETPDSSSRQQWKLLKQDSNVAVYRERHSRTSTRSSFPSHQPQKVQGKPFRFLTRGTVDGNVYDAVFGCLCVTTNQIRVRAACRDDPLHNAAVLAIVEPPTHTNPLQAISIQWLSLRLPLGLHWLAKHPDAVVLDATGFTRLPNGEEIGYYVVHSISHPALPALPNHSRATFSSVTLFHQRSTHAHAVDVNVQMTIIMKVPAFGAVLARHISKLVTNGGIAMETATMRKLEWLLQTRHRTRTRTRVTSMAPCISCGKNAPAFGPSRNCCAVCGNSLCRKCSQRQTLYAIAPDLRMLAFVHVLCRSCHNQIAAVDVLTIAADDAEAIVDKQLKLTSLPSLSQVSDATCISLSDNVAKLVLSARWMQVSWSSDESVEPWNEDDQDDAATCSGRSKHKHIAI